MGVEGEKGEKVVEEIMTEECRCPRVESLQCGSGSVKPLSESRLGSFGGAFLWGLVTPSFNLSIFRSTSFSPFWFSRAFISVNH